MKLTNKQLNIIKKVITTTRDRQINDFKNSGEYQNLHDEIYNSDDYQELLSISESIRSLETERRSIDLLIGQERNQLRTMMNIEQYTRYGSNYYNPESEIPRRLETKIEEALAEKFPSLDDLEADILVMAIRGEDNILDALLTKYKLNAETGERSQG